MASSVHQTVTFLDETLRVRPCINKEQIKTLVEECYGLQIDDEFEPKELVSYDDRNFLIKGTFSSKVEDKSNESYSTFNKFVLKIFNTAVSFSKEHYNKLCQQLIFVQQKCGNDFKVPHPIQTVSKSNTTDDDGDVEYIALYPLPLSGNVRFDGCLKEELQRKNVLVEDPEKGLIAHHLIRLTVFIEGCVPDEKKYLDRKLAYNWGKCNGLLNKYLQESCGPSCDEVPGVSPVWDMLRCAEPLKKYYLNAIKDERQRQCSLNVIKEFEERTLPRLNEIEKVKGRSWIHSDVNDSNLVINKQDDIVGVIDFDDMNYSYQIVDIGVSMMYACVKSPPDDFMTYLRIFYQGYTSVKEVSDMELSVLYNLCQMRFVQSASVSTYQVVFVDPGNEYLKLHGNNKTWEYLFKFLEIGEKEFLNQLCS